MGDTGDKGGQTPATVGNGRRLTYAQIASRLGISGDAARILVRRRGWTRIMPNRHGAPAVIIVPDEALDAEDWRRVGADIPDIDREDTGDETATHPDIAADVRVITAEQRATEAERRADEANQRADAALSLADRTMAQLAEASERAGQAEHRADTASRRADRAEAAIATERSRADALRERLDESQHDAQAAREAADALRRAEEVRKARGRWARLRAAWRGE